MNRMAPLDADAVRTCPRCGYTGEGVGYFRRPGRLALLVGLSLFTYGLGGVVYWLARRGHVVCPGCGLTWHEAALARVSHRGRAVRRPPVQEVLPSSGLRRRTLGVLLVLVAAALVIAGIADFRLEAIGAGTGLGLGGAGMFAWGWRALLERRTALAQSVERRILQLATRRGGTLTVTEAAAELDLSLPAAERALTAMDDGFRVRSEITEEGILVYEFPEVLHRALGGHGPSPAE